MALAHASEMASIRSSRAPCGNRRPAAWSLTNTRISWSAEGCARNERITDEVAPHETTAPGRTIDRSAVPSVGGHALYLAPRQPNAIAVRRADLPIPSGEHTPGEW